MFIISAVVGRPVYSPDRPLVTCLVSGGRTCCVDISKIKAGKRTGLKKVASITMSGFDYIFVCQVPAEYMCLICQCAMRKPVQTKCGHRFCKDCLQESMRRLQECPIDRNLLDESCATDIYPDVACERTILDFQVECPNENNGCEWTGELRRVEAHVEICLFSRVTCPNKDCDVIIQRKDLQRHVTNECPRRSMECDYCKESYVWCLKQDHLMKCSKYPCTCILECGRNNIPRNEMNDHIKRVCPLTEVDCTFTHVGCQVKVQRNGLSQHVQANIESHLNLSCKKLQELQAEHDATTKELQAENEAKKIQMEKLQAEHDDTKKRMEKLQDAVVANEFIWKLTEFEKLLKKAKYGIQTSFYSDSFYTAPYGYKMCVRIDPNGDGSGKNTHLSVFVHLQRGDHDAILAWPFNQKVLVTLLDQQEDQTQKKDKQFSFVAGNETGVSRNFVRPTSQRNVGLGFPTFISLNDLRTRRYLVDDTLFIQVKVKPGST